MNTVRIEMWRPYSFGELPALIAEGLHDGEDVRIAAEFDIEAELVHSVDAGRIVVRSLVTMMPHELPIGPALRKAKLLAYEVCELLRQRGIHVVEVAVDDPVEAPSLTERVSIQPTSTESDLQPLTARQISAIFAVLPEPKANLAWWKTRLSDHARYGLTGSLAVRGGPGIGARWKVLAVGGWLVDRRGGREPHLPIKKVRAALIAIPEYSDLAERLFPVET